MCGTLPTTTEYSYHPSADTSSLFKFFTLRVSCSAETLVFCLCLDQSWGGAVSEKCAQWFFIKLATYALTMHCDVNNSRDGLGGWVWGEQAIKFHMCTWCIWPWMQPSPTVWFNCTLLLTEHHSYPTMWLLHARSFANTNIHSLMNTLLWLGFLELIIVQQLPHLKESVQKPTLPPSPPHRVLEILVAVSLVKNLLHEKIHASFCALMCVVLFCRKKNSSAIWMIFSDQVMISGKEWSLLDLSNVFLRSSGAPQAECHLVPLYWRYGRHLLSR